MLGRIAIAAMGGCFSQNPDTGAAEATYFPAESVVISRSFSRSTSRTAGTTDFVKGFTLTRFWAKNQIITANYDAYPSLVSLGTRDFVSTTNQRTWCFMGFFPSAQGAQIVHMENETSRALSKKTNPSDILIAAKDSGTDSHSYAAGGTKSVLTTRVVEDSMKNRPFSFTTNMQYHQPFAIRFYGDMMQNGPYGIHWHRLPMRCVGTPAIATFDIAGKQLVEY